MHHIAMSRIACVAAALLAPPADAQFGDFLKRIPIPGRPSPSASDSTAASATGDEAAADAPPVKPPKNYSSEMAPDPTCSRPRDRFNVAEKLTEYGGTAANLRLRRLISTNFEYSDLKPEDHQMLSYLAQTTVWIPAEAEAKLGAIYDTASGIFKRGGESMNELDRAALAEINDRLAKVKGAVAEYPAEIRLTYDSKLADGAFARFGGVIQLSERFLNGLSDAGTGADFLLAHEISHVYKRHAIKDIQFKMISSAEGWGLARKVLQRAQRGMEVDPLGDASFLVTTMPRLIEFVRSVQVQFTKDQELEADACSIHWLTAVQTDFYAAWNRYKAALGANTTYSLEHPTSQEREAWFKRRIAGGKDNAPDKSPDKGTVQRGGERIIQGGSRQKRP